MKPLYLFLLVCFTSCLTAYSQTPGDIDSIIVYADFSKHGYTTASAYSHFDELRKNNIERVIVSVEDKSKIEAILGKAQKKKHYQTKVGQRNLFCEAVFSGSDHPHRVLISGVIVSSTNMFGKKNKPSAVITDLTEMRNYIITAVKDLEWISGFREKIAKPLH